MANNRMFIRCKTCGNYIHIASILLPIPYVANFDMQELQDFFTEHFNCTKEEVNDNYLKPPFKYEDVDLENNFEIAYETIVEKKLEEGKNG